MKMKLSIKVILFITAVFVLSCDNKTGVTEMFNANQETPPFVITQPVCEINKKPGHFTYAGIVFNYLNTTEKIVKSITASFMVYDADTRENAFNGSNIFEITMLGAVIPFENKEINISLDQYIYLAPKSPYIIDFFYISEVRYTDEAVWEDKYGIHRIR